MNVIVGVGAVDSLSGFDCCDVGGFFWTVSLSVVSSFSCPTNLRWLNNGIVNRLVTEDFLSISHQQKQRFVVYFATVSTYG